MSDVKHRLAYIFAILLVASAILLSPIGTLSFELGEFCSIEAAYASDYNNRSTTDSDGDTYYHFNPAMIFDTSGKSANNDGIAGGFVGIIEFVITKIALPIGILLSTWRVIYLAIFPLIIGNDPLGMTDSPRYNQVRKGNADSQGELDNNWRFDSNPIESFNSYMGASGKTGKGLWAGKQSDERNNMMDTSFTSNTSYANMRANQKQENNVSKYIMEECKFMFLGLLITFIAWGLMELLLKISVFILNMTDSATQGAIVS